MIKATLTTRCGCTRTLDLSEGAAPPELRLALDTYFSLRETIVPPDPEHRTFRLVSSKGKLAEYEEV